MAAPAVEDEVALGESRVAGGDDPADGPASSGVFSVQPLSISSRWYGSTER